MKSSESLQQIKERRDKKFLKILILSVLSESSDYCKVDPDILNKVGPHKMAIRKAEFVLRHWERWLKRERKERKYWHWVEARRQALLNPSTDPTFYEV